MSWDVWIVSVPEGIGSVKEFDDDFQSELGSHDYVNQTFAKLFPDIDFSDPDWGLLDRGNCSMEINIGKDDPVDSVMLHVRGGDDSIELIRAICQETGWRAVDTTAGDFIDFDGDSTKGFREWTEFRDRVQKNMEDKYRKKWWQFWR